MDSSDDESYGRRRRNKRRKVTTRTSEPSQTESESILSVPFAPLLDLVNQSCSEDVDSAFEDLIEDLLPEFLQERFNWQGREAEVDSFGRKVRPLTRHEVVSFIEEAERRASVAPLNEAQSINLRKLKLQRERRRAGLPETPLKTSYVGAVTPLPSTPPLPVVNNQVIDALYSIKTTPYECSYLSRHSGGIANAMDGVISVDWETSSPWMELMKDVRDHYRLAHSEREQANESLAPIVYRSIRVQDLNQVHDLLGRVFWSGIDVSDSLQFSPERSTVLATYKRLVVGAAFLSSPQETYITYLAVRGCWENSQIATTMLYHLITLNPKKDINLHVSANNPAMLLYNRFGFKAEEFIVGFYDEYLNPESRSSKNAFRLRLRR